MTTEKNFVTVNKSRGNIYVFENNIFKRYCTRSTSLKYLKCEAIGCKATAVLCDGVMRLETPHNHTGNAEDEVKRLKTVERCRKRAADEPTESLRRLFDNECREESSSVAARLSFSQIESSMYKRRRRVMPTLPTAVEDVHDFIANTEYEQKFINQWN
jgi:hypothetical protein